jgi:hypothetical protein
MTPVKRIDPAPMFLSSSLAAAYLGMIAVAVVPAVPAPGGY